MKEAIICNGHINLINLQIVNVRISCKERILIVTQDALLFPSTFETNEYVSQNMSVISRTNEASASQAVWTVRDSQLFIAYFKTWNNSANIMNKKFT